MCIVLLYSKINQLEMHVSSSFRQAPSNVTDSFTVGIGQCGFDYSKRQYRLPVIGCRDLSVNLGALCMKSEEDNVLLVVD